MAEGTATHTRRRGASRARHPRNQAAAPRGLRPGIVYGGSDGDCVTFKVDARVLRQVLVDGSALIDLEGRRQHPPGDRQGPAAAPGARRGHPHRPARGAPRREDPDHGRRARRGRRGGARHQGGRRARAGHPPAQHRGAAHGHPGRHRRRRVAAWRSPPRCTSPSSPPPRASTFLDDPEETIIATVVVPTEVEEPEIEEETELVGEDGEPIEGRGRRGRGGASPRARPPPRRPKATRSRASSAAGAAGAGRLTGWWSGSVIPATATPAPATTWASRWPTLAAERWGLPKAKKKYGGLFTDGRIARAGRAWRCCCRRPT